MAGTYFIWHNVYDDGGDLAATKNRIGANEGTILISYEIDVTADLTIPTNITLKFIEGGCLNISTGKTVTINGDIDAGLYQIFKGSGGVAFGSHAIKEVYPQWWGAQGDDTNDDITAINAAADKAPEGSTLRLTEGEFKISSAIAFTKQLNVTGMGARTIIHNVGTGDAFTIGTSGTNLRGLNMKDFHIYGASGTLDALHLNNVHQSHFKNIIVGGMGNAGFYLHGCLLNEFDACVASINAKIPGKTVAAMKYGVVFDILNSINSNANVFNAFSAEGITTAPGIGLYFINGYGNVFVGGTTESNTIGVKVEAGCPYANTLQNVHFETNGTDYDGTVDKMNFISCYGISPNVITAKTLFNSPSGISFQGDRNIRYGTAAPGSGTWVTGSIILNQSPVTGGVLGWICTSGGTPGTWKAIGVVDLQASDTWVNPGAIADGTEVVKDVTATGAALGDFALASLSCDALDLLVTAQVTAANTVSVSLGNLTGGNITLNGGGNFTVYVKVIRKT